MVECVIGTLKEQCTHRHRFETLQHASRVIGAWLQFYNQKRPHQALRMQAPTAAFALAAQPEQILLGHYIQARMQMCSHWQRGADALLRRGVGWTVRRSDTGVHFK